MKVLLVNSPEAHQGGVSNPVLGLLYLAGNIRNICEVDYIDGFTEGWDNIHKKMEEFKPDIVGTSILTPARHSSLKVLKMAKKYGAITICGGAHATIMDEQIMNKYPFVDYILKGESEGTLKYFLMNFDKFKDKRQIISYSELLDINEIKFPAWDLANLDTNKYIGDDDIRIPIILSRGCTGHCAFCSTWKVWKGYRSRSPENITEEIEYIIRDFNKRHFVFEDDAISCNLENSKEVMKLIIQKKLNIKFFATTRADGIDEEFVSLLKEAGCYGISIGFESGSQRILDIMKKDTSVEQNIKAAQYIKKADIKLCALMIINSVGETDKTRKESEEFLSIIQADDRGYLCEGLWILPGTYFYSLLKREGFIDDSFWLADKPVYYYGGEIDYLYE